MKVSDATDTNTDDDKKLLKILGDKYREAGHPLAGAGVGAVYRYFKGRLSLSKIERFLQKFPEFTLHREIKKPRQYVPSYVRMLREQLHLDLFSFYRQEVYNKGFKYCLVIMDNFSKYAWCEPLLTKTGKEVTAVVKRLFDTMIGPEVENLIIDAGKEFLNKHFIDFCRERRINLVVPKTSGKAFASERLIRTLKDAISRYMTLHNTKNFVDILPKILESYNNKYHRTIGTTPIKMELNDSERNRVRNLFEERYARQKVKKASYKLNQLVRISRLLGRFARGFNQRFSQELFIIQGISTHLPLPLYTLSDITGTEFIRGSFKPSEITPVILSISRDVQRILRNEEGDFLIVKLKPLFNVRKTVKIHRQNFTQ